VYSSRLVKDKEGEEETGPSEREGREIERRIIACTCHLTKSDRKLSRSSFRRHRTSIIFPGAHAYWFPMDVFIEWILIFCAEEAIGPLLLL